MLKITKLEVVHLGEEEARKLLPFIKNADVYSPESALATEEKDRVGELGWKKILESKMSRTKFSKLRPVIEGNNKYVEKWNNKYVEKGNNKYAEKELDYLFVNKIPIWFLERGNSERVKILNDLTVASEEGAHIAAKDLIQGNITGYVTHFFNSLKLQARYTEIRDRDIALNLESAEANIREFYPQIADREPLKLTFNLGALHKPERYTSLPIEIRSLIGGADPIIIEGTAVLKDISDGKSLEVMRKAILRLGLESLLSGGRVSFDRSLLKELNERELENFIRSVKKIRSKAPLHT